MNEEFYFNIPSGVSVESLDQIRKINYKNEKRKDKENNLNITSVNSLNQNKIINSDNEKKNTNEFYFNIPPGVSVESLDEKRKINYDIEKRQHRKSY